MSKQHHHISVDIAAARARYGIDLINHAPFCAVKARDMVLKPNGKPGIKDVVRGEPDCWLGCYDFGWLGEIVPEAFTHPAKIARGLIRRIYEHSFAEGWLRPGDLVVDPFGGIGGTAIDAALRGARWIGSELEPKFVSVGNQNIELWQRKYSDLNGWIRPVLLQGDSRRLSQNVGSAEIVCGSPPYADMHVNRKDEIKERWGCGSDLSNYEFDGYGEAHGQLGNMGDGHEETFWSAAAEIVAQCHVILRPGGHAVWVTKDFVRKGKRVPFSDQWQALCELKGFRLVCRHRAMLVTRHGEQETIFGGTEVVTTTRKSFFRRLAESKGSPRIDWEDVICLEKPE